MSCYVDVCHVTVALMSLMHQQQHAIYSGLIAVNQQHATSTGGRGRGHDVTDDVTAVDEGHDGESEVEEASTNENTALRSRDDGQQQQTSTVQRHQGMIIMYLLQVESVINSVIPHDECWWAAHLTYFGVNKPLESVTHSQSNASPTLTFPAAGNECYQMILVGDRGTYMCVCVNNLPKVAT